MPRTATKKVAKKTKKSCAITITLGNDVLRGEGNSLNEAFMSIPRPEKIVTKGIVVIETNGGSKTWVLPPIGVKKLFYPVAAKYVVKKMEFGL
jgi:hypothetical protein